MDCSRIRVLLSEYLDGEIQGSRCDEVREHLAACDACAQVLAGLQCTSRLLAEAGEIEPPAYLLEQIEAATINSRTFFQRVGDSFSRLIQSPSPARWAAASSVAVIAIVLAIMVHYAPTRIAYHPVKLHAPATIAVTPQPTTKIGPIVVAEMSPVPEHVRLPRTHRRHSVMLAKNSPVQPSSVNAPARSAIVAAKITATSPSETASPAAEASPTANVTVAAAPPAPETNREIKLATASGGQTDLTQKEADALAGVREKLAARNKRRGYQVQTEPVKGNKVSVDLASIRF